MTNYFDNLKLILRFSCDGTEAMTSVADYFQVKYKKKLQYPMLPAIQSGNNSKPVYLPMEVTHSLLTFEFYSPSFLLLLSFCMF